MRLHLPFPDRRMFGGIAIGVIVGIIAVGAVSAASPAPSGPSASASTNASAKAGIKLGLLRQAVRGNFRVDVTATNRNGTHNVLYVRGTLDVSPTSLVVTLPDNSTQAYTVDSSTVVRDEGKRVDYAMLKDGERAMVFGMKNADGSYTAKLIRCVKEAPASATP